MLTLDKVYKASHLLKSVARYTDMIESNGLTDDCQLRLKAENLQLTGSFKLRGAFFKIANLPPDDREIVACSAGNHSQGVSLAAGKLHRKAVIFMPSIVPKSIWSMAFTMMRIWRRKNIAKNMILYLSILLMMKM